MRIVAIVLAVVLAVLSVSSASAMSFQVKKLKSGQTVVLATGPIESGDAAKLETALRRASRDGHGTKRLLLNSPGGLVGEALLMTQVMDSVGVTTVIQNGATCASACASVLFVSGKYRTLEKTGALVIHSCYDARDGRAVTECNAVISAHAESEGVSGLGLMALQEAAGSQSAFLLTREDAACFGLTRAPGASNNRNPPCVADIKRAGRHK